MTMPSLRRLAASLVAITIASTLSYAQDNWVRDPRRPMGVQPDHAVVQARSINLNELVPFLDGQWQGSKRAADGNIYFASSSHSGNHGAAFFRFDPRANELKMLCDDMTRVCGEDPQQNPQGKMHSDIVEAKGWLYFTTHFSSERPGAKLTYTGAHVLGYELATGTFRDFGVAHPGYTIYSGVGVDPDGRWIFCTPTPLSNEQVAAGGQAHLVRFDIATGEKHDLGTITPGNHVAIYTLLVAGNGDCWFSPRTTPGRVWRYSMEQNKLESWENAVPGYRAGERVEGQRPGNAGWWHWSRRLGEGDRRVVSIMGEPRVWTFDPSLAPDWDKAWKMGPATGPLFLGMDYAGGRVYYIQRATRKTQVKGDDHHLFSVALEPVESVPVDHGLIVDQDGHRPWRIESIVADGAGRVFTVGDWYALPGEKGMMRYRPGPEGQDAWAEQIRNQRFAWMDVSAQIAAKLETGAGGK